LLLVQLVLEFGQSAFERVELLDGLLDPSALLLLRIILLGVTHNFLQDVHELADLLVEFVLLDFESGVEVLLDVLGVAAEFAPVLLTLLDAFGLALQFLLVAQPVDLLDEEVAGPFVFRANLHYLREVLLDVQQDVHVFVVLPRFEVECNVLFVDKVP